MSAAIDAPDHRQHHLHRLRHRRYPHAPRAPPLTHRNPPSNQPTLQVRFPSLHITPLRRTIRTEPPSCVCTPTFVLSGQHLTWARDHIIHTPSPAPPALHGGRGIVHIVVIDATAADIRDAAAAAAARIRDLPAGSSAVLAWEGDAKGFGILCQGPPPKALLAVVISGSNDDDYDEDADADSSSISRSFAASCSGTLHELPLSPPFSFQC
jgi:hypothetical protein